MNMTGHGQLEGVTDVTPSQLPERLVRPRGIEPLTFGFVVLHRA